MLLENSPTGQYVCTRRNRCGVSVMDKLPQEILVAILSYLPLNEILQTALVCKSWNAAQSEALSRSGAHVEVHQSVFVTDILCSIKVADIAGFIRSRLGHSINRVNIFCKRNFQMFAELSFPVVTTLGLDIAVLKLFVQSYSRSHARLVESLLIIGIHDSPEGPLPLVARHFPNLVRLELDLALGSNIKPLELFPRLQVFNVRVFSRERDERPLFPLPLNLTSLRDFIIRYEHIGNLTDIKAECLDHVFAMAPALEMSTVTNSQEYISEKVLISLLRASRSGFLSSLKHLILKFHIESPHRWLDLISDILHTGNLLLESVRVANSIYNEHLTRCLRQQKNLKLFQTTWDISAVPQLYNYLRGAIELMFDPSTRLQLLILSLTGLSKCSSLYDIVTKFLRHSSNCKEICLHVKLLRHFFHRRSGSCGYVEVIWLRWSQSDVLGATEIRSPQNSKALFQQSGIDEYKWIRLIHSTS